MATELSSQLRTRIYVNRLQSSTFVPSEKEKKESKRQSRRGSDASTDCSDFEEDVEVKKVHATAPIRLEARRGVFGHESFRTLKTWGEAIERSGSGKDGKDLDRANILRCYGYGKTGCEKTGGDVGVLWPTLSNELRLGRKEMKSYFDMFAPKVVGKVEWSPDCVVQVLGAEKDVAVWSGSYAFPMAEGKVASARFTFVLQRLDKAMLNEAGMRKENGKSFEEGDRIWRIVSHHSSLPPEA